MSFALTAFLAKKAGAITLLRIDDMDRERSQDAYVQDIFDTLHFLQIPWQEGPNTPNEFKAQFSQVHRLPQYNEWLERLKKDRRVFACTCSRSQLATEENGGSYPGTCRYKGIPLETPGVSWRLYTDNRLLTIRSLKGGEWQVSLPAEMKDFIVRKKDGFPAYQLTSVADDLYWKTDMIVRGNDLKASTLAQLFLADVMNLDKFGDTRFYHHLLLNAGDGIKLSKSSGATSIRFLRSEGKTPPDIFRAVTAMAGLKEPAEDWYSLGNLLYDLG